VTIKSFDVVITTDAGGLCQVAPLGVEVVSLTTSVARDFQRFSDASPRLRSAHSFSAYITMIHNALRSTPTDIISGGTGSNRLRSRGRGVVTISVSFVCLKKIA
jgi:hypothetical protein